MQNEMLLQGEESVKLSAEASVGDQGTTSNKKVVLKQKSKITKKEQKNQIAKNENGTFTSSASADDMTASTKDHDLVFRNIIYLLKANDYLNYQDTMRCQLPLNPKKGGVIRKISDHSQLS